MKGTIKNNYMCRFIYILWEVVNIEKYNISCTFKKEQYSDKELKNIVTKKVENVINRDISKNKEKKWLK